MSDHASDGTEDWVIGPLISYGIGIVLCFLVWLLSAKLSGDAYVWMSGHPKSEAYIAYWPISLTITYWIFTQGNQRAIPVGWRGVPTFLGGRLDRIIKIRCIGKLMLILKEGHLWMPPWITGYIPYDHQRQTSPDLEATNITTDGITVIGALFYRYRITDPYTHLDVKRDSESLNQIAIASFKNCLARNAFETLREDEAQSHVAASINQALQIVSEGKFGVTIDEVYIKWVKPPADYQDALDEKSLNEVKAKAEKVLFDSMIERIEQLKATGITAESAAQKIQAERGTIESKYQNTTVRFDDAELFASTLSKAVEKIFGKG